MAIHNKSKETNARASPSSDVDAIPKYKNIRASPPSDGPDKNLRSQSTLTSKLRLATWNLGTMTGRSHELSEILKVRQINACCVQETKWKGSKARNIGNDYKLLYHGTTNKRNGVGIILDGNLSQRIINIERRSDRLMVVKLAMDNQPPLNIISPYAPQTGCSEQEKHDFWEDFDEIMQNIPQAEYVHIGGDLNGHVGQEKGIYASAHGGYGYGTINQQGMDILNFATKFNLKIINTHFKKKQEHLITYKSSNHSTQIDYILSNSNMLKLYKDCKVIPGNALTSQHRLLVSIMTLPKPLRIHRDKTEYIKWKDVHGPKGIILLDHIFSYLDEDLKIDKPANVMWSDFETFCQDKARQILGVTRKAPPKNKDPSWWNGTVKDLIKSKKEVFKTWQKSGLDEDHDTYKNIKKVVKSAVAQSRAASTKDFYERMEGAENENAIYKIARQRHNATLDIKANKYIKNAQGTLLTSNKEINERWKEYYEQLMNEEYPRKETFSSPPTLGPLNQIAPEETRKAIIAMKYHKAVGPDQIPADI